MNKYLIAFLILGVAMTPSTILAAEEGSELETIIGINTPTFKIFSSIESLTEEHLFTPFPGNEEIMGSTFDTGDVNFDGKDEIIIGAGKNERPVVKIYNQEGLLLNEFLVLPEDFTKGIRVYTHDIQNDGDDEIIISALVGGGPQIRIFESDGKHLYSFFAFDKEQRGGVSAAIGDVTGDGQKNIVAGSGEGIDATVKIFDIYTNYISEFTPYEDYNSGVEVEVFDINNDGIDEIITSPTGNLAPTIKIFNNEGELLNEFFAYHPGFGGGVNFDVTRIDNEPVFITGAGFSGGSHVRFLNQEGNNVGDPTFFAFDDFVGGVMTRALSNGKFVVSTHYIPKTDKTKQRQIIEVDLSKQQLYTYDRSELIKTYWISSGTWKYPTPQGEFSVTRKRKSATMQWSYGIDHPDNYRLPNVPNILSFKGAYTIHGAYWHNNFGYQMSHGCVNMSISDSAEVYDWAQIGTQVQIHS